MGVVFRDTTDLDYGWSILARDKIGRYRGVNVEASLRSLEYAEVGLRLAMAEALDAPPDELGEQFDEPDAPIDLLTVDPKLPKSALHPYFLELTERPARQPARAVIH